VFLLSTAIPVGPCGIRVLGIRRCVDILSRRNRVDRFVDVARRVESVRRWDGFRGLRSGPRSETRAVTRRGRPRTVEPGGCRYRPSPAGSARGRWHPREGWPASREGGSELREHQADPERVTPTGRGQREVSRSEWWSINPASLCCSRGPRWCCQRGPGPSCPGQGVMAGRPVRLRQCRAGVARRRRHGGPVLAGLPGLARVVGGCPGACSERTGYRARWGCCPPHPCCCRLAPRTAGECRPRPCSRSIIWCAHLVGDL
jgi:hypothetical protein